MVDKQDQKIIAIRTTRHLRRLLDHARYVSDQSSAARALMLLGAAHAGLDIDDLLKEIVVEANKPLDSAVVAALHALLPGSPRRMSNNPSNNSSNNGLDTDSFTDHEPDTSEPANKADLFSFGVDV
jgi:hypothetical protein